MSVITADRVKETSTTTGTGAFTLAGAVSGFRTFASAFGSGTTSNISYCIENPGAGEWEVGKGSFNGTTGFTRTTVEASSNAGSAVNFSAGTKFVFCTFSGVDAAIVTSGGTAYGVIGYAKSDAVVTVNPDPSSPTTIDSLSVTFTIAVTTVLRLTCFMRFGKSGGGIRANFYVGSTDYSSADVHAAGSAYAGWYSWTGNGNESGNQQLAMSQIITLVAGTYTITAKEAAAGNNNQLKLGERYLMVEAIA